MAPTRRQKNEKSIFKTYRRVQIVGAIMSTHSLCVAVTAGRMSAKTIEVKHPNKLITESTNRALSRMSGLRSKWAQNCVCVYVEKMFLFLFGSTKPLKRRRWHTQNRCFNTKFSLLPFYCFSICRNGVCIFAVNDFSNHRTSYTIACNAYPSATAQNDLWLK